MTPSRWIPLIGYRRDVLARDLVAAVIVTLMLVPRRWPTQSSGHLGLRHHLGHPDRHQPAATCAGRGGGRPQPGGDGLGACRGAWGHLLLALTGTIGAWGWIGVLPLATGLMKTCPAYSLLGINTCKFDK
jgi:hypothetical protein